MIFKRKNFPFLLLAFLIYQCAGKPALQFESGQKHVLQKNNLSIECTKIRGKMKMAVRGSTLKLSEISPQQLKCENQTVQFLELFINDRIIIDDDLIKVGEAMQVAIIAPIWEIIGNRIINLNGTHGEVHKEPKATLRHVSEKNVTLVVDGPNGKPGQPGGPAGNFYGIGKQFINGGNLTITAHGGDGSAGQDGCDGVNGQKGRTYNFEQRIDIDGILGLYNNVTDEYEYIYKYYELDEDPDYIKRINYTKPLYIENCRKNVRYCYLCHVYGLPGSAGGNGGNGGAGGKGGKKGEVKLVYLEQDGLINWSAEDGKDGKDGKGGKKGIGGSNGDMVEVYRMDAMSLKSKIFTPLDVVPSNIKQKDGEDGHTGGNLIGQKRLREAFVIQDFPSTINRFKSYSRYHLVNASRYSQFRYFLMAVISNEAIVRNYTTLGFVDEFTDLELQFFELKDQIDLNEYYKALYKNLNSFKDSLKAGEENRFILMELSKKIENVILNIVDDDYYVVPKVLEFVGEVEKQNKYVSSLHSVNEKRQIFENYKMIIDTDLESAQDKIETVIETKIDTIMEELDTEVDQLLIQITDVQSKAEENKKKLEEKQENLQSVLKNRMLCGILKFISGGLSKIHPLAGAGAAVVDGVITTYEDSLDEKVVLASVIPKTIVKSLNSAEAQLKLNKEADTRKMTKHLEMIKKQMENANEENKIVLEEVEKAVESAIVEVSTSEVEKSSYEIELEKLKETEEKLKKKGLNKDKIYSRTFDFLKNLTQLVSLTEVLGEYRAKYIKDECSVNEVQKLIDEESQAIMKLKKLESNVYAVMLPMLNNMKESVGITNDILGSKSVVDLGIINWQMESNLNKLLNDIDEFKKGFHVEKSFDFTINELKSAIDILIKTYGKMKEYSEKRADAKLVYDLLKAGQESGLYIISSSDNILREALSKMEEVHQFNIAVSKYRRLLMAFQQYAFPNSAQTLKTMSQISYRAIGENLKNLEVSIIKNVNDMRIGVSTAEHKFLVDKIATHFDTGSNFFHEWKNEKYNYDIQKLLEGKEVSLFADISEHPNLNGVRFNQIVLQFKSKNPDLQKELDDVMKQFTFKLIHEGDSHYRCGETIFFAKNNPTKLLYNLKKHEDQSQESISLFTKHIFEGEPLLSPYATWKVQIVSENDFSPEILKKFINQVNVRLIGKGVYTKVDNFGVCENLKQTYTKKSTNDKMNWFMTIL